MNTSVEPSVRGVAPGDSLAGPLQTELTQIWQEVLEVPEIGPNDDFFELGGHSLLSIEIRTRVKKALGVSFVRIDLLSTPTVALMAESILEQLSSAVAGSGRMGAVA